MGTSSARRWPCLDAQRSASPCYWWSQLTEVWRQEGLFARWDLFTLLPILTQGWGGIIVGLIAKTAGSVKKGFAVTVGLLFTCLLKGFVEAEPLSPSTYVAVPLVALSIYLHSKYPPRKT